MNLKPLNNLVILEIVMEDKRNGLIIPDQYQEPNFGIVRAIGQGKKRANGTIVPIPLEIGNKVMVSSMGGRREMEYEGKSCWLIDADNIIGIVE